METTKLPVAVITNCSATRTVIPDIRGNDMPKGMDMKEACTEWVRRLKGFKGEKMTPAELYRGIAFHSVVKIGEFIPPQDIYIVSAGQGLMKLNQKIVPYDFTSDKNHPDAIQNVITREPFVFTVWWRMINTMLYSTSDPVAKVIGSDKKLVLIACNSRFLKLLPDDILSAGTEVGKIRLITTSNSGSMPKQLKPFVLRYSKHFGASTIGNRNDLNHRAALHFVRLLAENPELIDTTIEEQQSMIDGQFGVASVGILPANKDDVITQVFHGNPSLGEMSVRDAFTKVRRVHRVSIHPTRFNALWAKHFGKSIIAPSSSKVEGTQDTARVATAARSALAAIRGGLIKHSMKYATIESEQEALTVMQAFVEVLRSEGLIDTKFTSTDVSEFGVKYAQALGVPVPPQIASVVKCSFILKTYAEQLGLETVTTDSGSRYVYRIKE